MIHNFLKVNEGKNILIPIPNQKHKLNITLVNDIIEEYGLKIIKVKVNNRGEFKQLTNNLLKYYIDMEMKFRLKFYSIDSDDLIYFELL